MCVERFPCHDLSCGQRRVESSRRELPSHAKKGILYIPHSLCQAYICPVSAAGVNAQNAVNICWFHDGVRLCRPEASVPSGDDLFIVGLLDGTLNAIDPDTGAMLWRYDSGSPMVSVQTLESLIPGQRATPTFFPGADGGLYHYNSNGGNLEVLLCASPCSIRFSLALWGSALASGMARNLNPKWRPNCLFSQPFAYLAAFCAHFSGMLGLSHCPAAVHLCLIHNSHLFYRQLCRHPCRDT